MMYGYAMNGFGYFTMTLFWVVLIIAVVYTMRRTEWGKPPRKEEDQTLSILRERYAKGEMNKEEFEERRRALQ
jgi:putative membrane protein